MEHYHSTSTPQPSVSNFSLRTPPVDRSASRLEEECNLPPELCSNCSHGIKVWAPLFSSSFLCFNGFETHRFSHFVGIYSVGALSRSFNPCGADEGRVACNIKWTPWRCYWPESWSCWTAPSREVYIPISFVPVFFAVKVGSFL